MDIVANEKFLHGRVVFEQGKKYAVSDSLGAFFIHSGWAREANSKDKMDSIAVSSDELVTDAPATNPEGQVLEVHDANTANQITDK